MKGPPNGGMPPANGGGGIPGNGPGKPAGGAPPGGPNIPLNLPQIDVKIEVPKINLNIENYLVVAKMVESRLVVSLQASPTKS